MTTFHTAEMMMTKEEFQAAGMEFIKEAFAAGKMTAAAAMEASRFCGFNMTKMGKNKETGMGGKWAWFKRS